MLDSFPPSNPNARHTPIVQVVGYKNSGKTTLTSALVRLLSQEGLNIGTVKHDAHRFELDRPGTDTWKHQEAGAAVTAISSPGETAYFERRGRTLDELVQPLLEGGFGTPPRPLDLILVEGFKEAAYPKIVLLGREEDAGLLNALAGVEAVAVRFDAASAALRLQPGLPVFAAGDAAGIAAWLRERLGSAAAPGEGAR